MSTFNKESQIKKACERYDRAYQRFLFETHEYDSRIVRLGFFMTATRILVADPFPDPEVNNAVFDYLTALVEKDSGIMEPALHHLLIQESRPVVVQ